MPPAVTLLLVLLAYAIKTHSWSGTSSIISRVKLEQTTVQLGKTAGFDDVGHRLRLTVADYRGHC